MILHIIEKKEWAKVKSEGEYTPLSLEKEGFIHCCTREQVIEVADLFYKGHTELVLLCIDSNRVHSKIVFEDLYETNKLYPHIYGSLNVDAVFKVVNFEPNNDGSFILPKELDDNVDNYMKFNGHLF